MGVNNSYVPQGFSMMQVRGVADIHKIHSESQVNTLMCYLLFINNILVCSNNTFIGRVNL